MFQKILVPLDRSELAEQAIGQAASIARAASASLELVVVHEPIPFDGFADVPWSPEQGIDVRTYLAQIADEIRHGAGVEVTQTVLGGDPVESLTRHIWDAAIDLVVMTTHGRTGVSRAWFGSVADGLVRHSSVPILMLRPGNGAPRSKDQHPFQRIVVPLDGSPASAEILAPAAELARATGAQLFLISVVQPMPIVTPESSGPYSIPTVLVDDAATNVRTEEATGDLDAVARRLRAEGLADVETAVVVDERPAGAIAAFARTKSADLIAMATHGRGASRLFLGSVADGILRATRLPILLEHPLSVRNRSAVVGPPAGG